LPITSAGKAGDIHQDYEVAQAAVTAALNGIVEEA